MYTTETAAKIVRSIDNSNKFFIITKSLCNLFWLSSNLLIFVNTVSNDLSLPVTFDERIEVGSVMPSRHQIRWSSAFWPPVWNIQISLESHSPHIFELWRIKNSDSIRNRHLKYTLGSEGPQGMKFLNHAISCFQKVRTIQKYVWTFGSQRPSVYEHTKSFDSLFQPPQGPLPSKIQSIVRSSFEDLSREHT